MNCQLQLDGCDGRAVNKHHRQMRSQGGNDEDFNILHLCLNCHTYIHGNPKESYDNGWLVYSWQNSELVPVIFPDKTVKADEWQEWTTRWNTDEEVVRTPPESAVVEEGDTCPVCLRRKPHTKKASSPKTKVSSIRVPLDDAESFDEMVDAAAAHLGLKEKPHWRYFTILHGLVLALQETPDAA